MGKRLGLIIGINNYHDATFRPLNYAENDARALAQWLVNNRGGNWNPPDVQLLLGEQANAKLAETLITLSCLSVADQDDLVFIYFAGHAFVNETTGEGYLAFANTHITQPSTAISLHTLLSGPVLQSRAAQIVLLIDGFQSGPTWTRQRSSPFDFKPLLGPKWQNSLKLVQGRLLYCSCRGNDYAPEIGEKNFGQLVYHMIIGLSGPAIDPASVQSTLQSLHAFLLNALDEQHQPQVFGLEHRPIVIVGEMPSNSKKKNVVSDLPVPSALQSSPSSYQATTNYAPEYLSQSAIGIANAQTSPSTSGEISTQILEQNRRNQCLKLLNQARQQVQLQNIPAALDTIENILNIAPGFVDALILKAQLLGTSGYLQDALTVANQVVELDPGNALAWSIYATLLANMGQLHEASTAIDRSLALSPNNPEALALRDAIQTNLARNALLEGDARASTLVASNRKKGSAKSILIATLIQFTALFVGILGASILVVRPQLPIIIAFLLESISLAILCVNAARGAYVYGIKHFIITCVSSLFALAILGVLYRFGYHWLINRVIALPPLLVPVLFIAFWLVTAAIVPFLIAFIALISGTITGVRRNQK